MRVYCQLQRCWHPLGSLSLAHLNALHLFSRRSCVQQAAPPIGAIHRIWLAAFVKPLGQGAQVTCTGDENEWDAMGGGRSAAAKVASGGPRQHSPGGRLCGRPQRFACLRSLDPAGVHARRPHKPADLLGTPPRGPAQGAARLCWRSNPSHKAKPSKCEGASRLDRSLGCVMLHHPGLS